jgi:succinate dehydrogenase flavin-adding protein (antitoxin of CptAB toxin-antitoxin module)
MRKLYPGDIYVTINKSMQKDKFVQAVKEKFEERSQTGIKKYNTTLEREDLNLIEWLNHAQEEAMDLTLYLERIKAELKVKLNIK